MSKKLDEELFEKHITKKLIDSGYILGNNEDFDKEYIIDKKLFFDYIKNTQPIKWEQLQERFHSDTEAEVLFRFENQLKTDTILNVLRNGFTVSGIQINCLTRRPENNRDPEHVEEYSKNIFSVNPQLVLKNGKRPDLVLFINGIPVATAELKNRLTGQTFVDSIKQYKTRESSEKMFEFKRGAIVHFAVDQHEVHLTTKLEQNETLFIPFNQGRNDGAGNPDPPSDEFQTHYLWNEIWQKDLWIDVITNFVIFQVILKDPGVPPKEKFVFPRYHQIQAVENLVESTRIKKTGTNYLIQHSAGSGKSFTIGWLANKLISLHDDNNNPIFDGVLILSDRRQIVKQLADNILQIDHKEKSILLMGSGKELAETLADKKIIAISTQQKFPNVLEYIDKVRGKNFAIIIDEAHSSQTPQSRENVQKTLASNLDDAESQEDKYDSSQGDMMDAIQKSMALRGPMANLSYYAFTATPKPNTEMLFGTTNPDGKTSAFHTYTMKQAIDEGFILNVLDNYIQYEEFFRLVQTSPGDKSVEGQKASRVLQKFVDEHEQRINQNVKTIITHFREHTIKKIKGQAKAMIVCSSREAARKYKLIIDEYVQEQKFDDVHPLIAFSGILEADGKTYSEINMNGDKITTPEAIVEAFDTEKYNIMIVADKYLTGFDQPLLHTMYVDKKLRGIKAVQTLSRLNRTTKDKTDTLIFDFKNTREDIFEAFSQFYQVTEIIDDISPNFIPSLYEKILDFSLVTKENLDIYANSSSVARFNIVDKIFENFKSLDEKKQDDFRGKISKFSNVYSLTSQCTRYDVKFEKMYLFADDFKKIIKLDGNGLPDLKGDASLQYYEHKKIFEGKIELEQSEAKVVTVSGNTIRKPPVITTLSTVIQSLNNAFGTEFSVLNEITIEDWYEVLKVDQDLIQIAKSNPYGDFIKHFEKKFLEQATMSEDVALGQSILNDDRVKKDLIYNASKLYHEWSKKASLPLITPANPIQNRDTYRSSIKRCKGTIKLIDPYLNSEALVFLTDSADFNQIKEIKLLNGLIDNYGVNEKLISTFVTLKKELAAKGILFEMKILTTKSSIPHDRFLIADNVKFQTISYTTLRSGRLSKITEISDEIPFEEFWNHPDSIDIESPKLPELISKILGYETVCSVCGVLTRVRSRPASGSSVYCKIHLKNR